MQDPSNLIPESHSPQASHRNQYEPCCLLRPSSLKTLFWGPSVQQHPATMGPQSAPKLLPVVLAPSFSNLGHLCPPESSASEEWLKNRGLLSRRPSERTRGQRGVAKGHTLCWRAPCSHAPVLYGRSQQPSHCYRKPHCEALLPKSPQQCVWGWNLTLRMLTKLTWSDVPGEAATDATAPQAEWQGRNPPPC